MKSFKEFISESPYVDKTMEPERFQKLRGIIPEELNKLHDKSEKIADTDIGSIHKLDFYGMNGYYHYVNGQPREFSLITKSNIQRQIDKNGGDGKYIKQIMKHHATEYGMIRSDEEQSPGGMKFWKSLYNEKDPNFSYINGKETLVSLDLGRNCRLKHD